MRIQSGSTDQTIAFVAKDSNGNRLIDLQLGNFVATRQRNNGAVALYVTPTFAQSSSSLMPGVYTLLVDEDTTIESNHHTEEYRVHITNTAGAMIPITRAVELTRLPAKVNVTEWLSVAAEEIMNETDFTTLLASVINPRTITSQAATALDVMYKKIVAIDTATFAATVNQFEINQTANSPRLYERHLLYCLSGTNQGQTVRILTYAFSGNNKVLLTTDPLQFVPAHDDTFLKIGRY